MPPKKQPPKRKAKPAEAGRVIPKAGSTINDIDTSGSEDDMPNLVNLGNGKKAATSAPAPKSSPAPQAAKSVPAPEEYHILHHTAAHNEIIASEKHKARSAQQNCSTQRDG
jgi:hypothetical protein